MAYVIAPSGTKISDQLALRRVASGSNPKTILAPFPAHSEQHFHPVHRIQPAWEKPFSPWRFLLFFSSSPLSFLLPFSHLRPSPRSLSNSPPEAVVATLPFCLAQPGGRPFITTISPPVRAACRPKVRSFSLAAGSLRPLSRLLPRNSIPTASLRLSFVVFTLTFPHVPIGSSIHPLPTVNLFSRFNNLKKKISSEADRKKGKKRKGLKGLKD